MRLKGMKVNQLKEKKWRVKEKHRKIERRGVMQKYKENKRKIGE